MKSKTLEEIVHLAIQATLWIGFAFYWALFSQTDKITDFILFIAPIIILISAMFLIVKRDRDVIRAKQRREEEEHQITIHAYDELRHDLLAFAAAIIILLIGKVFSAKIELDDVLQALIALIFMYLVKTIYFGRIR